MNATHDKLESLIQFLQPFFSAEELEDIIQFVAVDEYELAVETICASIIEKNRKVSKNCVERIRELISSLELHGHDTDLFADDRCSAKFHVDES